MRIENRDISFLALQKGAMASTETRKAQAAKKMCLEFEALFLQQVIHSMNQSIDHSALFGESNGSEIYMSLFESELAKQITATGEIGLGQKLYETMNKKLPLEKSAEPAVAQPDLSTPQNSEAGTSLIQRLQQHQKTVIEASEKYQLPPHLIYGVIAQESSGHTQAVSSAGAKGLMQLMDETASELGVTDPFDSQQNIMGGARYLRQQLDRFDNRVDLALAAYNAGAGSVEKYNGIPPFRETRDYVQRVTSMAEHLKSL